MSPRMPHLRSRHHAASTALCALTLALVASNPWLAATVRADVLTQRYDNGRTGRASEASITPASFTDGKWQKLATLAVDGAVYAQPLFVQGQRMSDGTIHNVVYIATARNK